MIPISSFEDVRKALEDIEKRMPKRNEVSPKKKRHFPDLKTDILNRLDEKENALATDENGNEFFVYKKDGKLFKISTTEVT
ncbi:MAG: hypothetical protein ACE5HI_16360 [bacterium]